MVSPNSDEPIEVMELPDADGPDPWEYWGQPCDWVENPLCGLPVEAWRWHYGSKSWIGVCNKHRTED